MVLVLDWGSPCRLCPPRHRLPACPWGLEIREARKSSSSPATGERRHPWRVWGCNVNHMQTKDYDDYAVWTFWLNIVFANCWASWFDWARASTWWTISNIGHLCNLDLDSPVSGKAVNVIGLCFLRFSPCLRPQRARDHSRRVGKDRGLVFETKTWFEGSRSL